MPDETHYLSESESAVSPPLNEVKSFDARLRRYRLRDKTKKWDAELQYPANTPTKTITFRAAHRLPPSTHSKSHLLTGITLHRAARGGTPNRRRKQCGIYRLHAPSTDGVDRAVHDGDV